MAFIKDRLVPLPVLAQAAAKNTAAINMIVVLFIVLLLTPLEKR
jgi:hypothetical protein